LRDLDESELIDERAAIAGLRFIGRIDGTARSPIDRYSYPAQDTDVRAEDDVHLPDGTSFGTVQEIDRWGRCVDIKKRGAQAEVYPSAVFAHSVVNSDVLADALLRIAEDVVQQGMAEEGGYKASLELLLSRPPRIRRPWSALHSSFPPFGRSLLNRRSRLPRSSRRREAFE
jgi:uncharacterized protein